jgi:hypothetical protein
VVIPATQSRQPTKIVFSLPMILEVEAMAKAEQNRRTVVAGLRIC